MIKKNIYRKAAKLIEKCKENYACCAIYSVCNSDVEPDELIMLIDVFMPSKKPENLWGSPWLSSLGITAYCEEGKTRRIIALELMYYILKDEGY